MEVFSSFFQWYILCRGVIRSRTGPAWTEDRIRVEARIEDRTGPVLDWSWAEKWHGLPVPHGMAVPPLFFVGHGRATHFIRSTLFFLGHGQPVLSGTTVPPFLFGPPVRTGTGPKTEMEILWTEDRTEITRSVRAGPVWSGFGPNNLHP